jgi:hypothetical protein
MILGTFWYFDFPIGLYEYDYFKFHKGLGGHLYNPAELIALVTTEHPDQLISDLEKIVATYPESVLIISQEGNKLELSIGGFQLYDYDFLLAKEVEKILKKHNVTSHEKLDFTNPERKRLSKETEDDDNSVPQKKFIQFVGSELKKSNAENAALRIDCNLELHKKNDFIAALKTIAIEEQFDVFFYLFNDCQDKTNLMLFFSNGRQGLNLTAKKRNNIVRFEAKIEQIMEQFKADFGHVGGYDCYPKGEPVIELIVDEEYIM